MSLTLFLCLSIICCFPSSIALEATGDLAVTQIGHADEQKNSRPLRHRTSSLGKWRRDSPRDVGGIISAPATTNSLLTAAHFRVLCYSCEFSQEGEVERQTSVRSLIFSPTRCITGTATCPVCLFPVNKTTRSCGGNYPQLISWSEIIPARTANNMQEISEQHIYRNEKGGGGVYC